MLTGVLPGGYTVRYVLSTAECEAGSLGLPLIRAYMVKHYLPYRIPYRASCTEGLETPFLVK